MSEWQSTTDNPAVGRSSESIWQRSCDRSWFPHSWPTACALWIHLPAQVTHLLTYPKLCSPCSWIRFTSLSLSPFSSLSLPHPHIHRKQPPKKPSTSVDQTAIPFHSIPLPLTLTLNPNSIFPTPINSFDLNHYHHHHPHLGETSHIRAVHIRYI